MAEITLNIGGFTYRLACRDGEEERLEQLGQFVNEKATDLQSTLGQISETRLLLMTAILTADELFEARGGAPDTAYEDATKALEEAAQRAENLAVKLLA
ncbi:MAG: cell division protein ZapA [Sphingomonadales bacterium]|jgi:cell division protein ZapA